MRKKSKEDRNSAVCDKRLVQLSTNQSVVADSPVLQAVFSNLALKFSHVYLCIVLCLIQTLKLV